jgi:hypothetical protein
MTAVIRLDLMLREAVATPYRDLVTRPTGVAVRNRVLTALHDAGEGDAHLDFSEVGLVDFSCADEIVAKLLVANALSGRRRMVLRGVREDHAEAIEHALARQDLVIVAVGVMPAVPRLLGAAPDEWRMAFGAVVALGRTPALAVAERLAWHETAARDVLERLADRRCIRVHPDATYECGVME